MKLFPSTMRSRKQVRQRLCQLGEERELEGLNKEDFMGVVGPQAADALETSGAPFKADS